MVVNGSSVKLFPQAKKCCLDILIISKNEYSRANVRISILLKFTVETTILLAVQPILNRWENYGNLTGWINAGRNRVEKVAGQVLLSGSDSD